MKLPPDEIRQRLIELHDALGQSAEHLEPLLKLLAEHGLSWSDLPKLFFLSGFKSTTGSKAFRHTICGIHGQVGRASTAPQQRSARNHLIKKLGALNWGTDLPGILATEWRESNPQDPDASATSAAANATSASAEAPNLFDLTVTVISDRVVLTPAQRTVAALRQICTHIRDLLSHMPQIGIVALASGRGKTTLRKVLEALEPYPWHSHNASPAVIYRVLDRNPQTSIHLEEAENLDWSPRSPMRAIVDAAFECDGSVDRVDPEGNPYKFPVFCALTWVLRGSRDDMPLAVRSRSLVMEMKKGKPRIRLPTDYLNDPDLVTARNQCEAFAAAVRSGAIQLNLDPPIPEELHRDDFRLEDVCRPLIAVADALGVGQEARAALIEFCADLPSADVGVQALKDIAKVFKTRTEHLFIVSTWTSRPRKELEPAAYDRIAKRALVQGLIDENPFWDHWRGPSDRGAPHPLTPGELSGVLSRFGIFVKTIWPLPRQPGDRSVSGYSVDQFAQAWAEYCPEDRTSTQTSKIIRLGRS